MIVSLFVVSLFPLALYLLVVAGINRRPRPTMVPAVWESAGLLFALSGFLLFTGPRLLNLLYERELLSISIDVDSAEPFETTWLKWNIIWAAYYAAVVLLAAAFFLLRRGSCGIYNVDLMRFRHALAATLEELGLDYETAGNNLLLFPRRPGADDGAKTGADAGPPNLECSGELRVEVFAAFCNVTLRWRSGAAELRGRFEAALGKHLEDAGAADNPSAGWFLLVSTLLFGAMVMLATYWALDRFFPRRHG